MNFLIEVIKFIFYSILIVAVSKYILVVTLRKLAESLNLKAKTIGNIAGYATSMPELLTVSTSSINGLMGASIYNVISSNVINLLQYLASIFLNRNGKALQHKTIKMNVILSILTIIIPILLIKFNVGMGLQIIPAFIIMYIFFIFLSATIHNKYLEKEKIEEKIGEGNTKSTIKYVIYLLLTGFLLFIIGNKLGDTLEALCSIFNISEIVIGILLGVITSIPELMTFLEAQRHHKKAKDDLTGVIEATNNLLSSNMLNLFVIQSIGIVIFTFTTSIY